ncbi:MAG TPA: GTPase [Thermoanaerobaculia bacterium]|nr:GTPase [Thermoanaerobaculia bacterium]
MLRAAIVGLPNVGKSTLFNALTRTRKARVANYPFCTIERNVGLVPVPEAELAPLAGTTTRPEATAASFELVDVAGLVKGASKGEGLGNKFLVHVHEVDSIIHVVRCFEDRDIVHVSHTLDPVADIETITSELALADLEFLTRKPTLFVCNVAEGDLVHADELGLVKKVRELSRRQGSETVAISARLEADLAGLSEADVRAHFASLGLGEPRAGMVLRAAYRLAAAAASARL